ncbi:hypothetical protein CMUS01_00653 [Colletotrichum musicola]|uniref:Uncharacterized protein n=1 Tax=Colletotrichum musicola TaxID=2175873 RepID=A0A8H6U965_9PEZI|nr:hypothetical protein CMUS01_00653 [Colletotrichum musicola]
MQQSNSVREGDILPEIKPSGDQQKNRHVLGRERGARHAERWEIRAAQCAVTAVLPSPPDPARRRQRTGLALSLHERRAMLKRGSPVRLASQRESQHNGFVPSVPDLASQRRPRWTGTPRQQKDSEVALGVRLWIANRWRTGGTKDCGRTGVILSSTGREYGGYGGLVLMWCSARHAAWIDGLDAWFQAPACRRRADFSLTMTDCLIFVRSDNDLFLTLRMPFPGMGLFGVDETSPVSEWNRRGREGMSGRALGRARQRAGEEHASFWDRTSPFNRSRLARAPGRDVESLMPERGRRRSREEERSADIFGTAVTTVEHGHF